jgi:hypothetical protein
MKSISPVLESPTVTVCKSPTVRSNSRCGNPTLQRWVKTPTTIYISGRVQQRSRRALRTFFENGGRDLIPASVPRHVP